MTNKMVKLPRLAIAAAAALIGVIALSASVMAQPATPHQFYGVGLSQGDEVGLGELSATADANGEWAIQTNDRVAAEVGEDSFTLNGAAATAVLTSQGATLTQVALTAAMVEDGDMMGEDDDMMGEDGDGEMMGEDDEMMGEDEEMMGEDEEMMGEDDEMMGEDEEHGFPGTGTGGLADSGLSNGLIGLLIVLGVAAVAGVGYSRIRNRA